MLQRSPHFRRLQLPHAMIAGILLAILYHSFPELPKDGLKPLVSHLLNIFYITLTLRSNNRNRRGGDVRGTVLFILWHYGLQASIGVGTVLLLSSLWYPRLAPVFGLFVPLGYALGPAQAYEIGSQWQDANGFNLGDIGLTFGALGYIWASFGGLLALNIFARRRGPYSQNSQEQLRRQVPVANKPNGDPYHSSLVYIFVCYGLGLLSLELIEMALLGLRSLTGKDWLPLMETLHSISFVFCALATMVFLQWLRLYHFLTGTKQKAQDEQSLSYLANIFVDVMVCAGIGSISFTLVWAYIDVIAILALFSAVLLTPLHFLLARYYFRSRQLEYSLVIYGGMMGTTSTGMALLGILDPYYESQAARDYLMATGFAFLGLLPIIVSLQWMNEGQYYLALGLYVTYALLTSALIAHRIATTKRAAHCDAPLKN